jgi:iron complex outermembrane receptor protein
VGYDNYDYLGNPQLKPETNNQADLTLRYIDKAAGSFYLNGFFSYLQDYIAAEKLAPSIAMSKTQGVLGVKQFYNADYALLRGFEFGYTSPTDRKLEITAIAAYTKATINSATRYIVKDKQVVGETTVKNDALPEIPPLEGRVNAAYKFFSGKLIPNATIRIVNEQAYTSSAFDEPETPGYCLFDFSVNYNPYKFVNLTAGVNNLFDKAYYEHLNRKIIGSTGKLYEPGRVIFMKLILSI